MHIFRITTLLFSLVTVSNAYAFKLLTDIDTGARWAEFPVVFKFTTSEFSQSVLDSSEYVAAAKAMETWSHIPGSKLAMQFDPQPFSGTCAEAVTQGENILCFFQTRTAINAILTEVEISEGMVAIGGAFSSTIAGALQGGFVFFNEEDHTFRTDSFSPDSATRFDLQSVLLHELGHVAGLDHTNHDAAVMFANSNPAISRGFRVPHEDDVRGIQFLYAGNEALPGVSCGHIQGNTKHFPLELLLLCFIIFMLRRAGRLKLLN